MCSPMKAADFEIEMAHLFVVSTENSAPMKMSYLWLTASFKKMFPIERMFG